MLFYLLSNPILILPVLAAIIIALTVHEFSHALVAEWLGDHTAKAMGRLTLNPLAHIHGLGFLLLMTVGFGWGKPVPYNEHNLKNPKWGAVLIGLAGPFSNLLLAILGIGLLSLMASQGLPANNLLAIFLTFLVQFNIVLLLFNLLPIPPLDGSKLLFALIPDKYDHVRRMIMVNGPFILLALVLLDYLSPVSIFGTIFNFFLQGIQSLIH